MVSDRTRAGGTAFADVLILKADALYGEALSRVVLELWPAASVRRATRLAQVASAITRSAPGLLLTGIEMLDGDVLDRIPEWKAACGGALKILVVTGRKEARVLAGLRALPVAGVLDSCEGEEGLRNALRTVAAGSSHWSRSIVDRLALECFSPQSLCRVLTPTEQLVLAVIGDGCDDATAALRLELQPPTVASVRRELHRKLRVQHKGDLIRIAVQHGFVRFTPEGTVRPGWSLLEKAWRAQGGGRGAKSVR